MENQSVTSELAHVSVKGKVHLAATTLVEGHMLVISGRWLTVASVFDEYWLPQGVTDPERVIASLLRETQRPDLFTFAQKITDPTPRCSYPFEWENAAVVPITTYANWWEALPQETRKNVRRAAKRSVKVRCVEFDASLVKGIKSIYDETPVRQGRRFWHCGKDLDTVRRENSSYLDRCQFVGAFLQDELIGFLKMVYVGKTSCLMQIVSKNDHQDKRPTNALIAKAVEVCAQRGMSCFVYGQYVYGKDENGPLTEFKRRNGFSKQVYPRYYIPLTAKGRLSIRCGLHLGWRRLLPGWLERCVLDARAKAYARFGPRGGESGSAGEPACEGAHLGQESQA